MIVKTLLTGEAAWVIYPEGRMVKNKKIMEKGRFMISYAGGKRPPHTGAATLALRTEFYRQRLLKLRDRRISRDGVIVIKAQRHRSREKNRQAALQRLQELVRSVAVVQKARQPTRPTRRSRQKRLDNKTRRGQTKALRGRVTE